MINSDMITASLLKFLIFLIGTFVILFLLKKIMWVLVRGIRELKRKQYTHSFLKSFFWAMFFYALAFSLSVFTSDKYLLNTLKSISVVLFGYASMVFTQALVELWTKSLGDSKKFRETMAPLVNKIINGTLILIIVMLVLNVWGVKITALLASLGVAGVAVALAVQATLGDFFSGLSILSDKTIGIGDVIELDDNVYGVVSDMSFRSVKVKTYNNDIIILPNSKVASSKIIIHNQLTPRRDYITFGVEYGSDIQKVRKIALKVVKSFKGVLKEPEPYVYFDGMGDFSLNFRIVYWMKSFDDLYSTKEKISEKLYNEFNKHKIAFAFPTQTVYLQNIKKGK